MTLSLRYAQAVASEEDVHWPLTGLMSAAHTVW